MEGSWVTGEDNDVVRGETRGRPTQGTVMRISLLGRFSSIIFGPVNWVLDGETEDGAGYMNYQEEQCGASCRLNCPAPRRCAIGT
jgi:hypothetical protein